MATIYFSHPNPRVKDVSKAIQTAERAAEITDHQDSIILDTLATAYATAGLIGRAVQTEEKALELASDQPNPQLTNQIRQRLDNFRQSQSLQSRKENQRRVRERYRGRVSRHVCKLNTARQTKEAPATIHQLRGKRS